MNAQPHRQLIPEPDAAAVLGMAPRRLADLRREGRGPSYFRLSSRHIGYHYTDLEKWARRTGLRSDSC